MGSPSDHYGDKKSIPRWVLGAPWEHIKSDVYMFGDLNVLWENL